MEMMRQEQLNKWKRDRNISEDPIDQSSSLIPKPSSNSAHLSSQLFEIRQQQLVDYKKKNKGKKSSSSSSSSSSSGGKSVGGSSRSVAPSTGSKAKVMTLNDLQRELLETDDSLAAMRKGEAAGGSSGTTKKKGGIKKIMMTISDLVRQESSPETLEEIGRKCLELTNTFRAQNGLSPLTWSGSMHSIGVIHSKSLSFQLSSPSFLIVEKIEKRGRKPEI